MKKASRTSSRVGAAAFGIDGAALADGYAQFGLSFGEAVDQAVQALSVHVAGFFGHLFHEFGQVFDFRMGIVVHNADGNEDEQFAVARATGGIAEDAPDDGQIAEDGGFVDGLAHSVAPQAAQHDGFAGVYADLCFGVAGRSFRVRWIFGRWR